MRTRCVSGGAELACDPNMSTPAETVRLKEKAESGDPASQRHLGWLYEKGQGVPKDLVESLAWYRKAATRGYAVAQNDVGCAYRNGLGIGQDSAEALKWFRLSAEQGHSYAQHNLASMYYGGEGTPVNYVEAAKWFSKAAEQGHSTAAYFLGWLYCSGNGVEKSYASALFWYRKAATEGVAGAQNNLAIMIENGQGVTANLEEAIRWFRKSARRGNESAKKSLERLKAPLEDPEIEPAPARKHPPREPKAKPTESAECKPLLTACTPLVYVHNAFRITGLLIDASTRDIKRRVDDLKAAAEMGDDDDEHTHAFALNPPPTVDQIREAAHRLHDPETRIIEELFWFWPQEWGQGKSDPALGALRNGNKDAAFKLWSAAIEDAEEPAGTIAKHNLAVMYQMVALDSENVALTGDLSAEQLATVAKYWTTCFKLWEEIADDETFWSLIADRIRHLDDHRLTTGFARRMRTTFPVAFDRINGMLAMQYAVKGKYDRAKKHIAYMNETHQGSDDVERVIGDILKPLEARVNDAVRAATAKFKEDATKGADAARELLDATKQPLAIARGLLDEGHAIRSYLFEHVYDACSTCLIAYGNKTEDWPTCIALLKTTEPLAVTDEARSKIRTNIAQAEKNHHEKTLYEICWFCKEAKAEMAHVLTVPMHGNVDRKWQFGGTQVTWSKLTAKVPRCAKCKKAHSTSTNMGCGLGVAGALLGSFAFPVGTIVGLIVGVAVGAIIARVIRPRGTVSQSAKASYPPIQKLLNEGWAFGEKP